MPSSPSTGSNRSASGVGCCRGAEECDYEMNMLRILAGVHTGAEVALPDGRTVLGRDDSCDLVFDDAGLAGRHVALHAGADLRLTVLDSALVFVDGEPVRESVVVEFYQVVSLGRLAFALGPAQGAWPAIDVASSPAVVGVSPPADPAEDDAPSDDAPAPVAAACAAVSPPARRFRRMASFTALCLFVLVACGVAVSFLGSTSPSFDRPGPEAAARAIRSIAARHGAVVLVEPVPLPDGSLSVSGYVDTAQTLRRVLSELAQAMIHATVHLVVTDDLVEAVTSVVDESVNSDKRNALHVRAVEGSPGDVVLFGYVDDSSTLAGIASVIERDVYAYRAIHYDIETRKDRLQLLRGRLDALGLKAPLRIQEVSGGVGLFGPVEGSTQLERILALAAEFNAEFDSRPLVRVSGTDSFVGESTIDLDVRSLVLGDSIHVVLGDGESHTVGSVVEDRYVVTALTERYMILRKSARIADGHAFAAPDVAYYLFDR